MKVSVVICTFNRADSLRQTLRCLRQQHHREFEVIVVNGPSTDDTETVLAEFAADIRVERNEFANLSVSRNIGINASAGKIVAFIDDDALPEFDWLSQALPSFSDPTVAGVGGIVFDHTGMALQYRYSAANRFGEATSSMETRFDTLCTPGSFTFPYLQGTNALFRRSALEEIGGFDETYDYYLDETDVCCRLVDAGFVLRQLDNAAVHHKFLPSGIRSHQRVVTNWYPIIKNFTYFGYRHALGGATELEIVDRSRAFIERCCIDAAFHEQAGRLPRGTVERVREIGGEALGRGIELGRERHFQRLEPLAPADEASFRPYPVIDWTGGRRVVIVSGDYPPRMTGGIARFIGDVAPELAAAGHEVRVITRSPDETGTVDLEDGVWVHRVACPPQDDGRGAVPDALPHINAFVSASVAELDRLGGWTHVDVVYGPAWDVEVLGALRASSLPVIAMLATPVAVAGRQNGFLSTDADRRNLAGLLAGERELFDGADALHAISSAIVQTVEDEYQLHIEPVRAITAPIGLVDRAPYAAPQTQHDGPLTVFFVGRLEARKGIDDLLAAAVTIGSSRDLRWVIAGADPGSPEGTREQVLQHTHGPSSWVDQITFLGPIDDTDLDGWLERSDIVVLPSRYESFGLVVVEGMMHARPVVTCAIGGIEEVISDREGILVAPADPDALAAAIIRLADDPQLRTELGAAGRKRFVAELSIGAAAARLDDVLTAVHLRSPGDRGCAVIGPSSTVRTVGGRDGVAMTESTEIVLAEVPAGARLSVHATGPAAVCVETGGVTRRHELTAGWTRLEVPSADRVVVRRGDGDVVVGGLLTIGHGR